MDIQHYLTLAVRTVFVENILLAYFLGMCSYLAISRKVTSAFGLGVAVIFVTAITTPACWLVEHFFLRKGALVWTGIPGAAGMDLSFLNLITFIAVIAAMVQLTEMFIEKTSPKMYNSLGIFLPLITANCAVLGTALLQVERDYTFSESLVYGVSGGTGWALAIVLLAATRYKLRYSNAPAGLRGLALAMLTTGLIALAFQAFTGINLPDSKKASPHAAPPPANPVVASLK